MQKLGGGGGVLMIRNEWVVHTDRTLELGVSPLVRVISLLLMLPSSVA